MVQKKLSRESRLLAKMKVPWEVVEASVETVQPSQEDLRKIFIRWSARGNVDDQIYRHPPRRAFSHSGENILTKIDISPDFSSFTLINHKKGRERSVSCPLGPRTLTRHRKNADFDAIIRDISDDSLYLRFKNSRIMASSNVKIDKNNNGSPAKSKSPPKSMESSTCGEIKGTDETEDDIWTDISLEVPSSDTTVQPGTDDFHIAHDNKSENKGDAAPLESELENPLLRLQVDATKEYWQFTQDVYRTLNGEEAVCSIPQPQTDSSSVEYNPGSYVDSDLRSSIDSPISSTEMLSVYNVCPMNPILSGTIGSTDNKAKLMDELLHDIYPKSGETSPAVRRKSDWAYHQIKKKESKRLVRFHSESGGFLLDIKVLPEEARKPLQPISEYELKSKVNLELIYMAEELRYLILDCGKRLVNELQSREELTTKRNESCDVLTAYLQAASKKRSEDTQMKFSVEPGPGDTGFTEWATAMKMVARLPEGVPQHFRKTLWLTLAEKHLASRGVTWQQTEKSLFSESCNPGDEELSVQIVKDLHRTGCSLFCGVSGQHNQAVLKRVLLAFARWNKNVGYCQGLNMLAALILQVMQGSQTSTVKVMIYLIEGVLPESYFGQNLRGLSVDMAVFRDLLRLKLPLLSKHLDLLQHESKEAGTSYEPPLMDVFTMQWLLTIFSNCLPQSTVLRVWDLLFLEGNQILLKTALAIWQYFSDRIMAVKSADEFYSSMAVYTREMLELGLLDPNSLIRAIDTLSIPEVAELREKYVYNITPWTVATVAKKGLRLLYDPYDSDEEHQNNWSDSGGGSDSSMKHKDSKLTPFSNHPDREKIALDISVLKKQYLKLRERQRQAHIIFTAACSSESLGSNSSPALNHLLLGKSALLSIRGRRIEGTIPPPLNKGKVEISGETLHWRDASDVRQPRPRRKNNARNNKISTQREEGDIESIRSRSDSSSSSGSSSSSTELCDDSSESCDDIPVDGSAIADVEVVAQMTKSSRSSSPIPDVESNLEDHEEVATVQNDGDQEDNGNEELEDENDDSETRGVGRRNSERALMQILRENSEILRRIQSQSAIKTITEMAPEEEQREKDDIIRELKLEVYRNSIRSLDRDMPEPEDIAEIRKKYSMNKQWSLDATSTAKRFPTEVSDKPKSFDMSSTTDIAISRDVLSDKIGPAKPFTPFPIRSPRKKSQLGVQLGLYSPDQDS